MRLSDSRHERLREANRPRLMEAKERTGFFDMFRLSCWQIWTPPSSTTQLRDVGCVGNMSGTWRDLSASAWISDDFHPLPLGISEIGLPLQGQKLACPKKGKWNLIHQNQVLMESHTQVAAAAIDDHKHIRSYNIMLIHIRSSWSSSFSLELPWNVRLKGPTDQSIGTWIYGIWMFLNALSHSSSTPRKHWSTAR